MLAGTVLLLEAILLGIVCLLLPRLEKRVQIAMKDIPQGMLAMAGELVPGVATAQKLLKMLPLLLKALLALALTCGALGIFALLSSTTPLWLNLLAWLSLAPFGCALVLLAKLAKTHQGAIRELLNARKKLRYP